MLLPVLIVLGSRRAAASGELCTSLALAPVLVAVVAVVVVVMTEQGRWVRSDWWW